MKFRSGNICQNKITGNFQKVQTWSLSKNKQEAPSTKENTETKLNK